MAMLIATELVSYKIFFALIWTYCFYQILPERNKLSQTRMSNIKQRAKYFDMIEWVVLALYLGMCFLKLEGRKILLLPFALLGLIITPLFFYFSKHKLLYFKNPPLLVMKILFWIQMILISLKGDGIMKNWEHVFYVPCIVAFILVAGSFVILIQTIFFTARHFRNRNFRCILSGYIWVFLNWFSSFPIGISCIGLIINFKEDNNGLLLISLFVGIVQGSILIFYSLWVRKNLEEFFFMPILIKERLKLERARNDQKFEQVEETTPYFLKVSSTYFTDKGFEMKDNKKLKEWKERICEIKYNKERKNEESKKNQ